MDYNDIFHLNEALITSIKKWNFNDGFFRSDPFSKGSPSFTTTGIVIQSLYESGEISMAQEIALKCIDYLKVIDKRVFPNENGGEPHVMCNSWMFSSIAHCFPTKLNDLIPNIEWFIENQNNDGSWYLYPNYPSNKPIWTGYCINTLINIYQKLARKDSSNIIFREKLYDSIKKGCDYLVSVRKKMTLIGYGLSLLMNAIII